MLGVVNLSDIYIHCKRHLKPIFSDLCECCDDRVNRGIRRERGINGCHGRWKNFLPFNIDNYEILEDTSLTDVNLETTGEDEYGRRTKA